MRKDVGRPGTQITVSLCQVADKQVFQKFLGENIKIGGISDLACDDLLKISLTTCREFPDHEPSRIASSDYHPR